MNHVEHGRTLGRMADANARMVQANSRPFVEFNTHNIGLVTLLIESEGEKAA